MFFRRDLYKKIKYYDINFIEYVPNTNRYSKHSYYLLKEFLNIININYYSRSVDNIISKNGKGTTAWAVKKNDSISNFEYDIELYFYYANKFPKNSLVQVKTLYCDCSNIELNVSNVHDNYQCLSFNLNSKEKGINYYTTNFNNSEDAMLIDNAIYINKNNHEAYSFFLEENGSIIKKNVYYNFFNNKSLNCALEAIYKICKKKFAHEDFLVANQIFDLPYLNIGLGKICYPITIGEKNDCV